MFTMAGCGSSSEPASTDTQKDTSGDTTAETTATAADTSDAVDTSAQADGMDALIEAAKAEGSLTVYGSCEEAYLSAACQKFEKLYDIKEDSGGKGKSIR